MATELPPLTTDEPAPLGDGEGAATRVAVESASGARAVHLNQYKLVVVKGGGAQRGREYNISGDVIRIGKVEGNDLVLPEETVSRVHCEILRDAKGHLLRDLHSTNGTFLDGAEIREAYVRSGSVITVGTVQLKFQPYEERIEILPSEKEELGELVGSSLKMREIFGLVERIAPTEATVLIEGETGTGKELLARTLHQLSRRKAGPFVVVDCGAVSGTLIESSCSATSAARSPAPSTTRQGAFELAHGGTIFLDELGELPARSAAEALARARAARDPARRRQSHHQGRRPRDRRDQPRSRRRSGEGQVPRGSLLPPRGGADPLPPLRDRKEDIPRSARAFLRRRWTARNRRAHGPARARSTLIAHDWPGNVRELRNVLERGGRGRAAAGRPSMRRCRTVTTRSVGSTSSRSAT